ncbi:hypothetical protein [Silvibacterium dinghuense]|uniref:DUF4034 domain-containing protein n=1 Tax=Silvibacterium dinghuense TaxID=1560006 RepID=A0A4Q1S8S5_9BACT|nr:hypothetical protein [Silvibacterium dinghuense]RXS93283.1 hypothetical protein ESZ00_18140 [Silvibacterium dinghuense]GGH04542.1 hypothetical protein GCM10011586_20730 [Silvibacterium dinghuense]
MNVSAFGLFLLLPLLSTGQIPGQTMSSMPAGHMPMDKASPALPAGEKLGVVAFPVSCAPAVQPAFNRGVALLHDFWYAETEPQFRRIVAQDPHCAMAHWGVAMSLYHQIWQRPDAATMAEGWKQIEQAQSLAAPTPRERAYIAALADFYQPGSQAYPERVQAYAAAMKELYRQYPDDVDAGAFYALSLLAAKAPDDTTVAPEEAAMQVLRPLFVKYPDNPGVVHYVIHACDNPELAPQGLAAADRYGLIAPSGAHAVHMSGHIYARLGLWPQDIDSQLASIRASDAAEAHRLSGLMDEPHSYDFLLYAYLQSGHDAEARAVLAKMPAVLARIDAMPGMGSGFMSGMVAYYQEKLPIFYDLEMQDWAAAANLTPAAGAPPDIAAMAWWARAVAHGHLKQAAAAQADLAAYDRLMASTRGTPRAYAAESTGARITRDEIAAWADYAADRPQDAVATMRAAADLQDKVG